MKAIIGSNGFVGSNLVGQTMFGRRFNSNNIHTIGSKRFDLIVSAAPSATMWLANARPEVDYENTQAFLRHLGAARTDRLVLISTVAVFDDLAAGYDEANCAYEATRAYGKHRRMIETFVQTRFEHVHVLRLPALFGPGLKKNFIFDLMNPVPSFLKRDAWDGLLEQVEPAAAEILRAAFGLDPASGMMRYERDVYQGTPLEGALIQALEGRGRTARYFTNSDSVYQYYNLDRLWRDIERCVELDIEVLNVCSEPLRAGEIFETLVGGEFRNPAPSPYRENIRSRHAAAWNGPGGYLYSSGDTLDGLRAFYQRRVH